MISPYVIPGLSPIRRKIPKKYTMNRVIEIVCEVHQTEYEVIKSESKIRENAYARFACYYFIKKYLNVSDKDIGVFLNREHSTVNRGFKAYESFFNNKDILSLRLMELHKIIDKRVKKLV